MATINPTIKIAMIAMRSRFVAFDEKSRVDAVPPEVADVVVKIVGVLEAVRVV